MPPQNSWFNPYPDPNQPNPVPLPESPNIGFGQVKPADDLAALRKWLTTKGGIDPGTPLDVGMRVPEETVKSIGGAPGSIWDYLAKDPHTAPPGAAPQQAPAAAAPPARPITPQQAPLTQGQFRVPSGYDASKSVVGSASFGGPKLNNEAALSGLKAANQPNPSPYSGNQFEQGYDNFDPYAPSQMAKNFGRDPQTTAPGASAYWGGQIQERQGDEAFQTALAQQQQKSISEGQTQQNPAIQASLQQGADRGGLGIAKVNAGATEAKLTALQTMMSGGMLPGSTVSMSGVGSFHTPIQQQIPAALYAQLTRDRANATVQDSFGRVNPQAKAAFDQTVQNVIAASIPRVGAEVAELVGFMIADPTIRVAPTADAALQILAQRPNGITLTDPQTGLPTINENEMQMIDQLFQLVK